MRFSFFHRNTTEHIFLFSIGEQSLLHALVQKQGAGFRVLDENSIFAKHQTAFFEEAVSFITQVLQKTAAAKARVVIGLRPGVAKSELAELKYPLPFPGKKISAQEEARILQEIKRKAESELCLLAGERTGLHPSDLIPISVQTFLPRIDGYSVPRLRGFTGSELAYGALGIFLPAKSARQLAGLSEYFKKYEIIITHSLLGLSALQQLKNIPALAVETGDAKTQISIFENNAPRFLKEIPFGERDITAAVEHELGMKKEAAVEFLSQYASGALSEEIRQRVRPLLLPAVEKFGTLVKESLARFSPPLSVFLYGEESTLPELREVFIQENFSLLPFPEPKDFELLKKPGDAVRARFVPLYLLLHSMELGKKFTDIIPPKRAAEKKESQTQIKTAESLLSEKIEDRALDIAGARSSRSPIFFWSLLFIVLAGAGFLASVLLAKARVAISPESRDLFIQDKIKTSVSQTTVDLENKVIPAVRLVEEKESTRPFPATGKKTKEAKAEGIIRVFNTYSTSPQTLVANTRFISENGKLFRSKSKTAVPAARYQNGNLVAGTIDIMVTAAESGDSYNIGPSNFSLPGLAGTPLYTAVYGKSLQAMAGGSQTQALAVTEDDIAHSKDQLIENLTKLGKEGVGAKIPAGYTLLPGFMASEVASVSSLAKEGAELEQFNVSAKVKATALVFKQEDAESLMKYLLSKTVAPNERIDEQSILVSLQEDRLETVAGAGIIAGTAKAKSPRIVDSTALKNDLNGLSRRDASLLLAGYPGVAQYQLSFSPFWLKRLPRSPDKIEITVP